MTFIMDPVVYPNIIKHGRQLDFHSFSDKVAPVVFGYPPVRNRRLPGMHDDILRSFKLLQGENLGTLTESMMGNLMMLFRQDHLEAGGGWRSGRMLEFCRAVMFEATFLTLYGSTASGGRHSEMVSLREDLERFDQHFPLLVASVPIALLRQAKTSRNRLIQSFLPHRMSCWSNTSRFIRRRQELFEQRDTLRDTDKGGRHTRAHTHKQS